MPRPTWDLPPLNVGSYSSHLPDPGALLGVAALPGTSGVPPEWAQRAVEAATVLSGHFLQGVAMTSGWPGSPIPLDSLLGAAVGIVEAAGTGDPLKILAAVTALVQETGLLRAVLEAPLEQAQALIVNALTSALGTAADLSQAIPIVGWIIAIIRGVVNASRTVRANNERGFGILPGTVEGLMKGVVPSFSRSRDDDAANALLAVLRGRDWTDVWVPNTAPWSKLALEVNGDGYIDGWYLGAGIVGGLATDIPMPGGTWSAIPGMAQLGSAYYGIFSGNDLETHSIGALYPSVVQLAGMAWMRMELPTGDCCNADPDAIEYAWGIWQGRAREFLETEAMKPRKPRKFRKDDEMMVKAIKGARKMVDAARGSPYHNGKRLDNPMYPGGRRQADYIAHRVRKACKAMRERIHDLLGTIACAYVPPDAPALRNRDLKLRYAAMRMRLLESPERHDVEIDLVPDDYFRNALAESRRVRRTDAVRRRPAVRRRLDRNPPRLPDAPGVEGASAGGGAAVGFAAVAAALVAGVAWKASR